MSNGPLRIMIDARVTPETWGGVAHAVKGLVQGLAQLDDGNEEFSVVVSKDTERAWIEPHIGRNQRLVDTRTAGANGRGTAAPSALPSPVRAARQFVGTQARRVLARLQEPPPMQIEKSDGFFESLGCDLAHFPTQRFVVCSLPSVFNPHDLQHLHYPQFFRPEEIARRELVYRTGCQLARCVVVGSAWIKNDVVSSYGIDARRVQVIPEGAPTQFTQHASAAALEAVRKKFDLHDPFVLFPAVAWPHKNHLRLFAALHLLRERFGMTVRLVCTGGPYPSFKPAIDKSLSDLQLEKQVRFLGFLSEADLTAAYGTAEAVILPSLFEASSLPIFEAWHAGVPSACSNATALPEQVVDAAVLFDPFDVPAMAEALRTLLTDAQLRATLVERGRRRLADFDWRQTARGYRAVYRRIGGRPLTDEDQWLLSWDSMRDAGSNRPGSTASGGGTPARP